jgi:hypothetical protein
MIRIYIDWLHIDATNCDSCLSTLVKESRKVKNTYGFGEKLHIVIFCLKNSMVKYTGRGLVWL